MKEVRFHGRVRRRSIQYIDEEDHENIWYTSEDYADARKREDALVHYVSSNNQVFKSIRENLNAEGVLTKEQELKLKDNIEVSTMAVFQEQEKPQCDYQTIANVYRSYSEKALKEAQLRAARHEKHLEAIGMSFVGYDSPTTYAKKGILRSQRPKSITPLATSS